MELRDVELFFYITDPASEDNNQVWTRVDIDQNSTFSFNLSQSDISDPTAVETGWSYQCSLPRTKNNEQVFSMIELLPATLTRFSSIARTQFRLYLQGNLFQEGYFGLEEITKKEYKVRFYGGLGDFFYALDSIKINELDNLQLKCGNTTISEVNSSVVQSCFADGNGASSDNPSTFGFALTYQGQYDNFDSDHDVIDGEPSEVTWTDADKGVTYSNPELNENRRNRSYGGTVYFGEYRSYYQRPMLRLQAIFEAIQKQVAKETDWTFELSPAFFNSKNPYYRDLWLVFSQLFTEQQADAQEVNFDEVFAQDAEGINHNGNCDESSSSINNYRGDPIDWDSDDTDILCNVGDGYEKWWNKGNDGAGGENLDAFVTDYIDESNPIEYRVPLATVAETGVNVFSLNLPMVIRGVRLLMGGQSYQSQIRKSAGEGHTITSNPLYLEVALMAGDVVVCKDSIALSSATLEFFSVHSNNENYRNRSYYFHAPNTGGRYYTWRFQEEGYDFTLFDGGITWRADVTAGDSVYLRFRFWGDPRWFRDGDPSNNINYTAPLVKLLKGGWLQMSAGEGGTGFRTGTTLTLSDVIQTETTAMEFVLSYAKIFGMYFVKDDITKTVTLMPRNAFYHGMRLDWTNKIDYSKDFTQTPCLVDYTKGTFALESIDGKYETDYKELYDKEYGAMVVNTGYELNREEKSYLDGNIFTRAVIARPYDQYFLGRTGIIYQDNKQSLYLQDSDGAGVDANMILVFRLFPGTTTDDNSPFLITDDNTAMYISGFMWNGESVSSGTNSRVRSCSTYPSLRNTVQDDAGNSYSLYFGAPNTLYNDYDTKETDTNIYSRCWQLYIQDQLNKDTKTLTCYVLLQPNEVSFELFRYIIYINNTAWILSDINGFNPLTGGATKCTLIRVNEETSYTQGQKLPVGNLIIRQGSSSSDDIYNYEKQIDNAYIDIEAGEMLDDDYVEVILYIQLDDLALELGGWELQYCTDGVLVEPSAEKNSTGWVRVKLSIPKNITFEERMFTVQLLWSSCMGVTIRIHQAAATPGEFTVTRADGTVVFDFEKEINEPIEVDLAGSTETLTFYYEKSKAFGNWEKTQESYDALMTPDYGGTNTAVQMQVNASTAENTYTYTFKWANQETVLTVLQRQTEPTPEFTVLNNGTIWYDLATSYNVGSVSVSSDGKTYQITVEANNEGWEFELDSQATYYIYSGNIGGTSCVISISIPSTTDDRTIAMTFTNIDGKGNSATINFKQTAPSLVRLVVSGSAVFCNDGSIIVSSITVSAGLVTIPYGIYKYGSMQDVEWEVYAQSGDISNITVTTDTPSARMGNITLSAVQSTTKTSKLGLRRTDTMTSPYGLTINRGSTNSLTMEVHEATDEEIAEMIANGDLIIDNNEED